MKLHTRVGLVTVAAVATAVVAVPVLEPGAGADDPRPLGPDSEVVWEGAEQVATLRSATAIEARHGQAAPSPLSVQMVEREDGLFVEVTFDEAKPHAEAEYWAFFVEDDFVGAVTAHSVGTIGTRIDDHARQAGLALRIEAVSDKREVLQSTGKIEVRP